MKNDCLEKRYGLVFEGGGAKGAYQIGVWKALKELGVKIDAVVGTSVGALNGALFGMGDLELALSIWENIRYSSIIQVEDEIIEKLANFKWKELSFQESIQQFLDIIRNRGLDITPLKMLLNELVDEERLRGSETNFGLVTFNLSEFKPMELMLEDIEEGQLAGFLLASSYLPSFKNERIFGKRFLDGGFHNVAPTSMLVERGYKDIIVVRIQGIGIEKKYDKKNLNIIEISTGEDLGRLLEFDPQRACKNIQLGYLDTLKIFRNYLGESYYINHQKKEAYYLKQFIMLKRGQVEAGLIQLGNKAKVRQYHSKERLVCEVLLPTIIKYFKVGKSMSYQHIYILLIEEVARKLDIDRMKVYSLHELKAEILDRLNVIESDQFEVFCLTNPIFELTLGLLQ